MENKEIVYYKKIDSTNTEICRLASKGAPHGTVVVAEEQTAGKGRRGRSWESPADGNIYMSILLRPKVEPEKAPMLTLVLAYCVAKVMQTWGIANVQIKWPNDLVLSGKKVCGILTEMHLDGRDVDYVVAGVGINVNTQHFPEELCGKATSLYLETGKTIDRRLLLEDILHVFELEYACFVETEDLSFLQEAYNEMLINAGAEVCVLEPDREYRAQAVGINRNGELIVRTAQGEEKAVYAGEVSVRGVYGYV